MHNLKKICFENFSFPVNVVESFDKFWIIPFFYVKKGKPVTILHPYKKSDCSLKYGYKCWGQWDLKQIFDLKFLINCFLKYKLVICFHKEHRNHFVVCFWSPFFFISLSNWLQYLDGSNGIWYFFSIYSKWKNGYLRRKTKVRKSMQKIKIIQVKNFCLIFRLVK